MRSVFVCLAVALWTTDASATTLLYQGSHYETVNNAESYERIAGIDMPEVFTTDMAFTAEIKFDFDLEPNRYYDFGNSLGYAYERHPYLAEKIGTPLHQELIEFQFSDGSSYSLGSPAVATVEFATNALGEVDFLAISAWAFFGLDDGWKFEVSPTNGDYASHYYAAPVDSPYGSVVAQVYYGGQTSTPGQWTVIPDVAAVPLPASGLALLAGLGGLAALRRRG